MRIWSFLRSLFRRKAQPTAAPAPTVAHEAAPELVAEEPPSAPQEAASAPAEAIAATAVEPEHEPEPVGEQADDDRAEDEGDEADEDADEEDEPEPDEPDPFIRETAPVVDAVPADVAALRAQARVEALSGEHRVPLSTPVGPGSLAEALNLLLEEGCVEAEFVDDPIDGSFILYRPIAPQA